MKKRVIIIISVLIFIFVVMFSYNKNASKTNFDKDLLKTVQSYDDQCTKLLKTEKISSYTVVLYNSQDINKIMIFKDDKFLGEASSSKLLNIYSTSSTVSDCTLFIIYGKSNKDFDKYNYHFDGMSISKKIESDYILDVYVLGVKYDLGTGEVINKNNQIIHTF